MLPIWATLNAPPARSLANPPVPLVADVLITNLSAAKPLIPPVEAAIGQMELLCVGSKSDAVPLTSGEVPESVQRLSRKGLPLVAAIASVPVEATRSQESSPPAAPEPESICQL